MRAADAHALCRDIFSSHGLPAPVSVEPMPPGVHSAYRVRVLSGESYVLRFALPGARGRAMLAREVGITRHIRRYSSLPVPCYVARGSSHGRAAYAIYRHLPGTAAAELMPRAGSRATTRAIYRLIGTILRALHEVPVPAPLQRAAGQDPIDAVARTFAERIDGRLGVVFHPHHRRALEAACSIVHDRVGGPVPGALLHRDAKPYNILVRRGRQGAGLVLAGLLDFDWAEAGDPLLDLASAGLQAGAWDRFLEPERYRSPQGPRPGRNAAMWDAAKIAGIQEGYFGQEAVPESLHRVLIAYSVVDVVQSIGRSSWAEPSASTFTARLAEALRSSLEHVH